MERIRELECECEVVDRPVNAFGDFICKPSNSSVKDIIRKFEEGEAPCTLGRASSSKSATSITPSEGMLERRILYEEQVSTPQRAVQMTVQEHFSKESTKRSFDKISDKKIHFDKKKMKSANQPKPEGSFTAKNPFVSDPENMIYPSKTTICKTDFGVRIILEIHFDPARSKIENWQDSRIETDIPSSEILSELQQRMI